MPFLIRSTPGSSFESTSWGTGRFGDTHCGAIIVLALERKQIIPLLAWGIIFGMGFQAWLGKTVVDSNLLPFKITVHMVMALVIVALLLYLYFISKPQATLPKLNSRIKQMAVFALV